MLLIFAVLILSLTTLINISLLWIVYSQSQHTKADTFFMFHVASIANWAFWLLLLLLYAKLHNYPVFTSTNTGYHIGQMVFISATLSFTTNYWFVVYFLYAKLKITVLNAAMGCLQLLALFLTLSRDTLYTSFQVQSGGYIVVNSGLYNGLYSFFLLTHLVVPLFLFLWFGHKETSPSKKKQFRVLFWSYLLFLIASMTCNWVLPVYFNIFNFNAYGPTTSLILIAGIAYAIMRYHFLNIRIYIQRGLIYTILLAGIIGLYVALLHSFSIFIGREAEAVSAGITTLIGIFTVPYIDKYLRKKTDKFFFKDSYNYADALYKLSDAIDKKLVLSDIIEQTETELKKLFKAEKVLVSTDDTFRPTVTNEQIDYNSPVIYIYHNDVIIGSICLSQKLSGDIYTNEDIALLKTFSNQVAITIENARLFKEVEDYSTELENRVDERTAKIKELQEMQQQVLLDISHNLQNPLTTVKSRLSTLAKQSSNTDDLATLEKSIDDISSFIYELLNFSRLEAMEHFDKKPFSLSKLINEQIEYYEIVALDQSVTLKGYVEDDVYILGDENKCKQLLNNLVSNAIKYKDTQKLTNSIDVSLRHTGTDAELVIKDSGLGIPSDEIGNIFDKFYRSTNTKRIVQGTGLGLAFVRTIVEMHNGTVRVVSELGTGSIFTITIPSEKIH